MGKHTAVGGFLGKNNDEALSPHNMAQVLSSMDDVVTLLDFSRANLIGNPDHAAAVAPCHTLTALLRNWRNVFREIRWRWT